MVFKGGCSEMVGKKWGSCLVIFCSAVDFPIYGLGQNGAEAFLIVLAH